MVRASTKGSTSVRIQGAGRAVRGVLAHAHAQPEPLLGVAVDGTRVVLSAPGASSLVYATLVAEAEPPPELAGSFEAPKPDNRMLRDGAEVEIGLDRDALWIAAGNRRLAARRLADAPVEVEWVWPAAAAEVELALNRASLLDALPAGEGVIRFDGLDKQLVLESEDGERRLALANRPRRRKPVSMRIAFARLRLAVEPQDERMVLGLTESRPLTVHSETARAVLSPLEPPPPTPRQAQPEPARRPAPTGTAQARTAADADRRRQEELRQAAERRREEEQRRAEERRQAEQARAAARATAKARHALDRAAFQLDAAAGALEGSPLDDLKPVVEELRERVKQARRSIDGEG
jgi:hypothetical protein